MNIIKQTKDQVVKLLLGKTSVPRGLAELHQYFRMNDPIEFRFEKQEDGSFIAISQNFRYGSIISHARTQQELEEKVKDASLQHLKFPHSMKKKPQCIV